jgi:PKD repeat protein
MNFKKKSICKSAFSVFTVLLILALLSSVASAKVTVTRTPLGAGTPPATVHLTCACGENSIDYTAVAASSDDPRIVKFKDLSEGDITYIRWDFGDGTSLEGTEITSSLRNPVHKFPKTGYYISCMTIKGSGCVEKMWVHKDVVIKPNSERSSSEEDVEPDSEPTKSSSKKDTKSDSKPARFSHQKELWNHFDEPDFYW